MPEKHKPSKKPLVEVDRAKLKLLSDFMHYLGAQGLGIVGFQYPAPRVRGNRVFKKQTCIQITVIKKLPLEQLHPNSPNEWNYLWAQWQAGDKLTDMQWADKTPIMIPKQLLDIPTDIIQASPAPSAEKP